MMLSVLSGLILFMHTPAINCQENVTVTTQNNTVNFYGHVFGGIGFSYLAAGDIKSLIGDEYGVGIGLPTWSYGVRAGYRHILQVEYNIGKANHDFRYNSIIKSIPSKVIHMNYDTHDVQFKINPKFWKSTTNEKGFTKAFFLVYGFGDVEWRDKNDDGFTGKSKIYGIEFATISKNTSLSISFKRYDIDFDKTILFNIPFDYKTNASDYILEMKAGFGFGK